MEPSRKCGTPAGASGATRGYKAPVNPLGLCSLCLYTSNVQGLWHSLLWYIRNFNNNTHQIRRESALYQWHEVSNGMADAGSP